MDAQPPATFIERQLQRVLSGSRWLMAPIYVGLAACLLLILAAFAFKAVKLCEAILTISSDELIIGILSLIDLSLVANLILIVVWAGYENFVSQLDSEHYPNRPEWIRHTSYGDLKLKLITSIVAITAIHLLEDFMNLDAETDRHMAWAVGVHLGFIVSALALAVMDRLSEPH